MIIADEDLFKRNITLNSVFRPRQHAVIFIRRGSIELSVNHVKAVFGANSIVFIYNRSSYELLNYSADLKLFIMESDNSTVNMPMSFNRFEIFKIISHSRENNMLLSATDFQFIWVLLEAIYQKFYETRPSYYKHEIIGELRRAVIFAMVDVLQRTENSVSKRVNKRKETIVIEFLKLVFSHSKVEKELKFYAEQLNISIKYLSITVKEFTGNPPTFYLHKSLINEACSLLATTDLPVVDIAFELGFTDQFVFSKFFKRYQGESPRSYRTTIFAIRAI